MLVKIPQTSQENACTRLSWLQHRCSREFSHFLEYCFYRTPLNDCIWFQFNLLTVLRRFCFRTDQYLFLIFPANLWHIKIYGPRPPWPHTFFTQNNYYRGKNYTCIKEVHDIYFIKYMKHFTKRSRVLNMPGFCIY